MAKRQTNICPALIRWLSIWLIASMTASSLAGHVAADPVPYTGNIELRSAEGARGDAVDIAVYATPEIMVWKYDITVQYDATVLELVVGQAVTDEIGIDADSLESFNYSLPAPDKIKVSAQLTSNMLLEEQHLFTLHFKIKDAAAFGDTSIVVPSGLGLLYEADDPIEAIATSGTIRVKAAKSSAAIEIGSVSGQPGSTVKVPVTAAEVSGGIGAYEMQFDIDPTVMTVTGAESEAGDYFEWHFDAQGGWLRVAWADSDGGETPIVTGDKLFTLTMAILSTASVGDKPLAVTDESDNNYFSLTDVSALEMEKSLTAGKVTVTPALAYTVSFDSQGGSAVETLYPIEAGAKISEPAAPARNGYSFEGWYKDAAGTSAWNFESDTVTTSFILYAKWSVIVNQAPTTDTDTVNPTPAPVAGGADILVNGRVERAGTATTEQINGRQVTTIEVDESKLQQRLEEEGERAVIALPVLTGSDVVIGELNGRMVKHMEGKQAVLEIRTPNAVYKLPSGQINIDDISNRFGANPALQDIKVRIEIAVPADETLQNVEKTMTEKGLAIVVPPLSFSVYAVYGDRTEEVTKFGAYVERTVLIPDGVDPSRITTGVVVEPDGTVRHVPTNIIRLDGKYYARINSLTSSIYSVVWHPLEFRDAADHWAKTAINDMGSRMIVEGAGNERFYPDRAITRAEFAAIMVRGLGLRMDSGNRVFTDVDRSGWHEGAIRTAYEQGLITGFEDGTFRPNDVITREQAIVMISRASAITGLTKESSTQSAADSIAKAFTDFAKVSTWALQGVADMARAGIVMGRSNGDLSPGVSVTRAEAATMMQRLLQASGLINEY